MISYLEGKLWSRNGDRVVVLVNGVGYEVLLPEIVRRRLEGKQAGSEGDRIELHIFYCHPERHQRPILIGFSEEFEREFFEQLLSVKSLGPIKAARSLSLPIPTIARAIEDEDLEILRRLRDVGIRMAQKMVAELRGKVAKFALLPEAETPETPPQPEQTAICAEVEEVLVKQCGYRVSEARRMVREALKRSPQISSPEELFEEVYRGER